MNIKNKIINLDNRDYHIHSLNFSDWFNSVDEIVHYLWSFDMKEIAITDHSDALMESLLKRFNITKNSFRYNIFQWKNVFNDISVIFWVEADIIDDDWNICTTVQWLEPDFINLSAHKTVYKWEKNSINKAYEKAIKKHYKKIKCICHLCSYSNFAETVDIEWLVKLANKYEIPLELNWQNLYEQNTDLSKLQILLKKSNRIYINSDSHTLFGLKEFRKNAINYLRENNFI